MRADVPPEHGVVRDEAQPDQPVDERDPLAKVAERRRRAAARELREDLGPVGGEPGLLAGEVRRVGREREHDGQPGERSLEGAEARLRIRHADVDVQPVDPLPPRRDAGIFDEGKVTGLGHDRLLLGPADRMRPRSEDLQPAVARKPPGDLAHLAQPRGGLGGGVADARVGLDDGREELGLDPPGPELRVGGRDDLRRGRRKQQRLGVDQHQLLLRPHGPRRALAPAGLLVHRAMIANGRPGWYGRPGPARVGAPREKGVWCSHRPQHAAVT